MYLCCVKTYVVLCCVLTLYVVSKSPCTIVQGHWPNFAKIEFSIFIIFSDTYTCTYMYVVSKL